MQVNQLNQITLTGRPVWGKNVAKRIPYFCFLSINISFAKGSKNSRSTNSNSIYNEGPPLPESRLEEAVILNRLYPIEPSQQTIFLRAPPHQMISRPSFRDCHLFDLIELCQIFYRFYRVLFFFNASASITGPNHLPQPRHTPCIRKPRNLPPSSSGPWRFFWQMGGWI